MEDHSVGNPTVEAGPSLAGSRKGTESSKKTSPKGRLPASILLTRPPPVLTESAERGLSW